MLAETNSFSATTIHLDYITTALTCLLPFGSKDDVVVYIDKDGLAFSRQANHIIRIQLFLSKELFLSYLFDLEEGEYMKLCLKLNHLLNSVNVAYRQQIDDVVECTFSYRGRGSPFMLILQDSYITEQVEYSTYITSELDDQLEGLELDRSKLQFECIIKGDVFHSALKDLKDIQCTDCYLYGKIDPTTNTKVFALISKSKLGMSKICLPIHKAILEKMEIFTPNQTFIAFFDFNIFDRIRQSIKIANKVLLRMDTNGLLNVNVLSQIDNVVATTANTETGKDYPGIIIEISLLEKEIIDEYTKDEIDELMKPSMKERTIDHYFPNTATNNNTTSSSFSNQDDTPNQESTSSNYEVTEDKSNFNSLFF